MHEIVFCDIMREIVIDTETTGLDLLGGDRVVEIGAAFIADEGAAR
jgi:DNA polymerase III epsilon subunit-like protein